MRTPAGSIAAAQKQRVASDLNQLIPEPCLIGWCLPIPDPRIEDENELLRRTITVSVR